MPRGSPSPLAGPTSTRPASCGESSTSRKGLRPMASCTSWAKSSEESCSRRTACCSLGVTVCCCRWRVCRVGKVIVRYASKGSERSRAARRGDVAEGHREQHPCQSDLAPIPPRQTLLSSGAGEVPANGRLQAALAVTFAALGARLRALGWRRTNAGRKTRREPSAKTTVMPSASTASTMPRP